MKKYLLLSAALVFMLFNHAWAQERSISGKVTSADDGSSMPGVTVVLKGTSIGAVTDLDGNYRVSVPSEGGTLVFSFVGLLTEEVVIGQRTVIDLAMKSDITQLSEVVVTGLGISRQESSLGYAVQEVSGDKLAMVNETNIVGSLTGKVAGVQVIGASGAALGGSTKIRLRGATTLGESSPLFVVDGTPISNESIGPDGRTHFGGGNRDYGNLASDINPNDIESISVLKGPSAAAIYGQRGANGVILITTKKGSSRQGIGLDYNHSTTFDKVYVLPSYQNTYGGGYSQTFPTFTYNPAVHPAEWAAWDGQNMINYAADESWGPKMDGTLVRHWDSWYPGDEYGKLRPFSPNPDNVRNFFDTGVTSSNNVAFSGGNNDTFFRMSLGNTNQTGVLPGSALKKVNVSFNGTAKLSEKLTSNASVMYTNTQANNRPRLGYGSGPVSSMNQWFQRQIDTDRLRNYQNADGTQRFWNLRAEDIASGVTPQQPLYWDNPYWDLYENTSHDNRDRTLGNVSLSYQLLENLKVSGFVRSDNYVQRIEEITASGGLELDRYLSRTLTGRENNYEFLAEYNKSVGDISINATLGGNIRKNFNSHLFEETVGGLSTPGFYDIAASKDRPDVDTYRSQKEVRSVYGTASFGYKEYLYLDVTGRRDISSSLPSANNAYFYPSISTSFVFSELLNSSVLSFGKVRASYAKLGSDISQYNIYTTYDVGNPYGSTGRLAVNNKLQNADLRPQLSTNMEIGTNMRFLSDRLGLDVNVYKTNVTDQILELTVPGSSGFSTAIVNAGEIESKGLEVVFNATPVKTADFSWDINLNGAHNQSTVISLAEGLENRELQKILSDRWGGLSLNARVGEKWGQFVGGGFARYQATDASGNNIDHPSNGKIMVDASGFYIYEQNVELGSLLPEFTGGIRNTFNYKDLSLSAFIDFQKGGQFFSVTRMFNDMAGQSAATAEINDNGKNVRDAVADGGGVRVDAVDESGNPVTHYLDAVDYYWGQFGLNEAYMYDASFIKLRELRVGYSLPANLIGKTPFRSINVAVIGKNLWLIKTNVDGIDPSEISEGIGGFNAAEGGVLPGVRSVGFNVRFGL